MLRLMAAMKRKREAFIANVNFAVDTKASLPQFVIRAQLLLIRTSNIIVLMEFNQRFNRCVLLRYDRVVNQYH